MALNVKFNRGNPPTAKLRRGLGLRRRVRGEFAQLLHAKQLGREHEREAQKVQKLQEAIKTGDVKTPREIHQLTVKLWPGMAYARERKAARP